MGLGRHRPFKGTQGVQKIANSIQARAIRELLRWDYDAIIDDDSSGEAADIVYIKMLGGLDSPIGIEVDFFHCKYSHGAQPGARVGDLYEVCGQAKKVSGGPQRPRRRQIFSRT